MKTVRNLDNFSMLCKKITRNFQWSEVLYLRQWDFYVYPDITQVKNLKRTINKLQMIRDMFGKPIRITSGLRPRVYNMAIGGAKNSWHIYGKAVDFVIKGYEGPDGCNTVREILQTKLEELDIRMENKKNAPWVHIDIGDVIGERYFKP